MRKTLIIIIVILFLAWLVEAGHMPGLVDLGHKLAENLFPPANP